MVCLVSIQYQLKFELERNVQCAIWEPLLDIHTSQQITSTEAIKSSLSGGWAEAVAGEENSTQQCKNPN